jgi:hypothetical protein
VCEGREDAPVSFPAFPSVNNGTGTAYYGPRNLGDAVRDVVVRTRRVIDAVPARA